MQDGVFFLRDLFCVKSLDSVSKLTQEAHRLASEPTPSGCGRRAARRANSHSSLQTSSERFRRSTRSRGRSALHGLSDIHLNFNTMARFNRGGNTNVCIAEGVKISIQTSLKKFTDDDDRKGNVIECYPELVLKYRWFRIRVSFVTDFRGAKVHPQCRSNSWS